jgi:pimeloyl-ACP methyl ester carboxylesterase
MQASAGDYTLLAQDADLSARVTQSISFGMYHSVECGEDMDALTEQDVRDAASPMNIALHEYILGSLAIEFEVCRIWQQDPVPTVQKQPVVSTIPTLVLEGEYDPITPPDNGRLVARTLSKSYFFQFPATGHGVLYTNKCPDAITTAFLSNPAMQPNASCITTMQEPDFQ